jgi:SAM-dependent methyltransferase
MMEIVPIPLDEIEFHPNSFCDRDGRVFRWQGELYRGITHHNATLYRDILGKGIVQTLVDQNFLIDTALTTLSLPGYAMVVKHRALPFVSYVHEWCPEMLKDAALFITDMMIELANHGLTLVDFSTWDMLFEGCRPVFVDFCTINCADFDGDRSWTMFKDDFQSYFIYPLRLMSQGYGHLMRYLLADHTHNLIHPELAALLGYPSLYADLLKRSGWHPKITWRNFPAAIHPLRQRSYWLLRRVLLWIGIDIQVRGCALIQQLRREVDAITLPSCARPADDDLTLPPFQEWTVKQIGVHQSLSKLRPKTVLDIGCGAGWYAHLAASLGSNVVALDWDAHQVGQCYQFARDRSLSILPLVMDICNPSPGQGICNKVIPPAIQRLTCEMVLALGLVHLLVFEQSLTFPQISETLASFAKRWVLVEFISFEDAEIHRQWPEKPIWYSLEHFIETLEQHFSEVTAQSAPVESRVLLLCEHGGYISGHSLLQRHA